MGLQDVLRLPDPPRTKDEKAQVVSNLLAFIVMLNVLLWINEPTLWAVLSSVGAGMVAWYVSWMVAVRPLRASADGQ